MGYVVGDMGIHWACPILKTVTSFPRLHVPVTDRRPMATNHATYLLPTTHQGYEGSLSDSAKQMLSALLEVRPWKRVNSDSKERTRALDFVKDINW